MASIFTRIIDGEVPGRFVWRDERCAAFLTIEPLARGHTLVVPREEVAHWIDLDAELATHLILVAQAIGRAQHAAFSPSRVGILVIGEEVPHTHIHLVPFHRLDQMDITNAERDADPADLDAAAERLRAALRDAGHPEVDASP